MKSIIQITGQGDTEIEPPKYFTGKMVGRWPELLRNHERAWVYETKRQAAEVLSQFAELGYAGQVLAA